MSKTKKKNANKRWKQRQKRAAERRLQKVIDRLGDDVECRINTGDDKMSDRLVDVAGPLMNDVRTREDAVKNLQIAAIGWNLAIMPEATRREAIANFDEVGDAADAEVMRALVELIIERKAIMYPDDRRTIADLSVEPGGGQWHIQVAYELDLDLEPPPTESTPPAQG